ncbi:hypothetical protein [Rhizobium sp. CC-YZS058]|uniref:hypothetical protein n=1 Tax=Rhizobium sp. CC-YZS058 TaxID=3042153 RepID=UPI002B060FF6|nr:hypothetical protein [Rhizobium sp. CC-YZS058]MEA3535536.1 hypothetical protein [Rhizobium sp. CC-YZS058]
MSSPLLVTTLAAGLMGAAPSSVDGTDRVLRVSDDCGMAAQQVVSETGGELLSVQPTGDGECVITVLIPGNGGRPKKMTVRVPM